MFMSLMTVPLMIMACMIMFLVITPCVAIFLISMPKIMLEIVVNIRAPKFPIALQFRQLNDDPVQGTPAQGSGIDTIEPLEDGLDSFPGLS
eukprot:jgi/Tetstr1/428519/TSEL_001849.t1